MKNKRSLIRENLKKLFLFTENLSSLFGLNYFDFLTGTIWDMLFEYFSIE